jgi:hypothetical protein
MTVDLELDVEKKSKKEVEEHVIGDLTKMKLKKWKEMSMTTMQMQKMMQMYHLIQTPHLNLNQLWKKLIIPSHLMNT